MHSCQAGLTQQLASRLINNLFQQRATYLLFWFLCAVGSWFFVPGLPLLNLDRPNLVTDNFTITLLNIGTNQTRYCAWNLTSDEENTFGVPSDQGKRTKT